MKDWGQERCSGEVTCGFANERFPSCAFVVKGC